MKVINISPLSSKVIQEIEHWLKKFPEEERKAAIIPSLKAAQEDNGGYLTNELIESVADYLRIPSIAAYEVATFYTMFDLKPVGKYKIYMCTNVSCLLCGSKKIFEYIQKKLNVKAGETTPDGKFSLYEVECLAACGGAPAMQINLEYHENLTEQKIDEIFAAYE